MNIYDKALQAINNNQLDARLYTGKRNHKHVFLSRTNGKVLLVYQKRDERGLARKVEQIRCAVYMPNRGWVFVLNRSEYKEWVRKTGHEIAKPEPVAPRLMCQELRQEWQAAGGV